MTQRVARVFGPVPSRRLGVSLGLDVVPLKTCSLDCVYCQLGSLGEPTLERRSFFTPSSLFAELEEKLPELSGLDHVTFSGSGEPTLNADLGRLIAGVKRLVAVPLCVITNSTLLGDAALRRELLPVDLLLPSLDAAEQRVFEAVNRPAPGLLVEEIIEGLVKLRMEFSGEMRLEIMLVSGVNDSPTSLDALRSAVGRIKPSRVQLNTVVRPPAEEWAVAVPAERLAEIGAGFPCPVEVIAGYQGLTERSRAVDLEAEILAYLERRPGRLDELAEMFGAGEPAVRDKLKSLISAGRVRSMRTDDAVYYVLERKGSR